MKLIPNLAPIDKKAIETCGIPGLLLMEAAGQAVAQRVKAIADENHWNNPEVVIVCGSGNNGGDGFVCARHLANWGFKCVTVLHTAPTEKYQGDAKTNLDQLDDYPLEINLIEQVDDVLGPCQEADIVVDALFGSGLTREVSGLYHSIIEVINASDAVVVAVDMPSGVQGETGRIMGIAVKAHYTVTFACAKPGLFLYPGKGCTGSVEIIDIGIPQELIDEDPSRIYIITRQWAKDNLPYRANESHKYQFGHVLVIAGSKPMPGAAIMASEAALRSGAGIVRLASPQSALDQMQLMPEIIHHPLPDNGKGIINKDALESLVPLFDSVSTIILGPGIGTDDETVGFVQNFLESLQNQFKGTVVIDADGLNCLNKLEIPPVLNDRIILTPHLGECARLTGLDKEIIQANLLEAAFRTAEKYQAIITLKSATTIICDSDRAYWINPTGNHGMATAGTGDILTGMIAGLAAQGISPQNAACLGVYLHGLSGDIGAKELTPYCLTATDILRYLPQALHHVIYS